MNGIVIMMGTAVILAAGYVGYGRWLAQKWGIDKQAITLARRLADGQNYVPASRFTVSPISSAPFAEPGP